MILDVVLPEVIGHGKVNQAHAVAMTCGAPEMGQAWPASPSKEREAPPRGGVVKRVAFIVAISTLAIAVGAPGVARATIDLVDFQAALDALFAVDPELAVHAQANSSAGHDFAVGGGQSSVGSNFGLSAHRQAGEDPHGHLSDTIPEDGKIRARIICLQVVTDPSGVKRAGMIGQITESSSNTAPAGNFIRVSVRDTGGPGGDGDGYRRAFTSIPPNPTVCPPQAVIFNIVHGNININDAQP
jgi:hypothetical protein